MFEEEDESCFKRSSCENRKAIGFPNPDASDINFSEIKSFKSSNCLSSSKKVPPLPKTNINNVGVVKKLNADGITLMHKFD